MHAPDAANRVPDAAFPGPRTKTTRPKKRGPVRSTHRAPQIPQLFRPARKADLTNVSGDYGTKSRFAATNSLAEIAALLDIFAMLTQVKSPDSKSVSFAVSVSAKQIAR